MSKKPGSDKSRIRSRSACRVYCSGTSSTQRLPAVSAAAAWLRRWGHSLRVRAPKMVSMAFPPFDGIIVSRQVKKDKQKQGDEQASPCKKLENQLPISST